MPLPAAGTQDVIDRGERIVDLLIRSVEMRREADAGLRPEVAQDIDAIQFQRHFARMRRADRYRAATASGVTRRAHVEAPAIGELDHPLRLADGLRANALDPRLRHDPG